MKTKPLIIIVLVLIITSCEKETTSNTVFTNKWWNSVSGDINVWFDADYTCVHEYLNFLYIQSVSLSQSGIIKTNGTWDKEGNKITFLSASLESNDLFDIDSTFISDIDVFEGYPIAGFFGDTSSAARLNDPGSIKFVNDNDPGLVWVITEIQADTFRIIIDSKEKTFIWDRDRTE